MDLPAIIAAVESLSFPKDSYIVFGSCPMAAAGIRKAGDIDMVVSKELFELLRDQDWVELVKSENDKPLTKGVFEVHSTSWVFSPHHPTLEQLLSTADYFEGIPFASIDEVRIWKQASGSPKDLADIKLINDFLNAK